MIIPTQGSIVRTFSNSKERIIKVKQIVLTHDNLYLIRYDDKNGKESAINCSLITEIIYYNKINPKPINYFNNQEENTFIHYKKNYCGSILSIVVNCISKLPYHIDRPIDSHKLSILFEKTKPGLVGWLDLGLSNHPGYPILKKDKIKKWVAKNWNKFLCNKNHWQKKIDQINKEIADDYWRGNEEEIEKDFENIF